MHNLLDLPQELRDRILEFTLEFADTRPPSPYPAGNRVERHDMDYVSHVGGNGIKYSARRPSTDILPLLLVNRQLHRETHATIDRMSRSYEFDIMLVNEDELYATWIYVPPLQQDVDTLHVTVRSFGISPFPSNGFADTEHGAGATVWRFYSLLERFVKFGAGDQASSDPTKNINISVLELNVLSPTEIPADGLAPMELNPDELPLYRSEHGTDAVMHPEALLKFLQLWIGAIVRMSVANIFLDVARYGMLFVGRVGTVRFMLDGVVKSEIELQESMEQIRVEATPARLAQMWHHSQYSTDTGDPSSV